MSQFHQVGFNVQVCCATVRPKRWLPTDRWHSEFTPASRHLRINDTFTVQEWLSSEIKEKLRGPKENHTTAMKFKEFVTFLLDKDGTFEEVKREFNASFYYMDDHWSSYYK